MASWVSHLIVADGVMKEIPELDRRGFCVGCIAPDCNIENEDWSGFTPSREVTHWMAEGDKSPRDAERFYRGYMLLHPAKSHEEQSFQWGYYAHLLTDAAFKLLVYDEERVAKSWERIDKIPELKEKAKGVERTYPGVKQLISNEERMTDIYQVEREYLDAHPDSGYLTDILPLEDFPDYLSYLPKGAIVRKLKVMGYMPPMRKARYPFLAVTKEEWLTYLEGTTKWAIRAIREKMAALEEDKAALDGR